MNLEIEAKMQLAEPERVIQRLVAEYGQPQSDVLETNIYFDTPDGRLVASDRGLRVRISRPYGSQEIIASGVVTYKGPREPGPVKRREEIEFSASDSQGARALLARLGFVEQLIFEKRRRTWPTESCEVVVDELPSLGFYLEIEGPRESDVLAMREHMDLGRIPLLTDNYAALVARHLRIAGRSDHVLVFDPPQ